MILPAAPARQSHYRRIADGIRAQIVEGVWTPGAQLPATDKLAEAWKASYGTVHTALQSLAKEGWIERLDGAGTFVSDFKNRFACAGIYHSTDIFGKEEESFPRALHTSLVRQFGAMEKQTQVFVDSRPESEQGEPLPALLDAIRLRRIQCLVAPRLNNIDGPALARLQLPTAFTVNAESPNQVIMNLRSLQRDAVRSLKEQGCRSVGIISHIRAEDRFEPDLNFYPSFEQTARIADLVTRAEWIRHPRIQVVELERYGYREFKALWNEPERPEGVIVYPDVVARGVIAAVLEIGMHEVTSQMKFVLHRNAHSHPLCPFPATWAVSDVDMVAGKLLDLIQQQFDGVKTAPLYVDHSFEQSGPEV